MRQVSCLVFRCALVFCAVPAFAQLQPEYQTGSLIPIKPESVDPKDAAIIRKHFAQCVYRGKPAKVEALLDHSDAATVDLRAAGIKNVKVEFDLDDCLGRATLADETQLGLKIPEKDLRDLVAEEAYLAHYKTIPPLPTPPPPISATFVSTGPALVFARAVSEFEDCTVTNDLVSVDRLVRSLPGSERERAIAAGLGPILGKCLVKGQQLRLTAGKVRAMVAYGLWNRFVRTPKP